MARTLSQLAATPVTVLKGVGPERAKALDKLEVKSVLDLLTYYPRRYLDRTREARVVGLRVGAEASGAVEVQPTNWRGARNPRHTAARDHARARGGATTSGVRRAVPVAAGARLAQTRARTALSRHLAPRRRRARAEVPRAVPVRANRGAAAGHR